MSSAIVSCSYLFVATFATTWGPVSWTYPAEIYPSKIRAKAVSLSTASNWFWNMVLAFAVPPLLWNISYKMYYIFGAFNAAAFVHMSLLAPETKGYTLEEMDEVFDSGRPAWKKLEKRSRLDELEREIEAGNLKVSSECPKHDNTAGSSMRLSNSRKQVAVPRGGPGTATGESLATPAAEPEKGPGPTATAAT